MAESIVQADQIFKQFQVNQPAKGVKQFRFRQSKFPEGLTVNSCSYSNIKNAI